jgi:hypothetical protein
MMLWKWLLWGVGTLFLLLVLMLVGLNVWGRVTLGQYEPAAGADRDETANRVVMVFGATGSVGDGLLKAAMQDLAVEEIHVVTRRYSPRIEAGETAGRLQVHVLRDFTDYSSLADTLPEVTTVLWGLGTSSLQVDDETYTLIHVDFPLAFARAWLASDAPHPRSFHFVTGVGTDPEADAHWAREKGRTERALKAMGDTHGMRSFSYRCAMVRPTSEQSGAGHYLMEALLRPGHQVISATALGQSMLEISARSGELPNGALIDTLDSLRYADAYRDAVKRTPK